MFDYFLDRDARPRGRIRTTPEIPATPYSKHIPEKRVVITRAEYAAEWIRYGVDNRPSAEEAMVALWVYGSVGIVMGGIAVAAVDNIFNLGLAHDLANIKVDEHAGGLEQQLQAIGHEIGVAAGGQEK